MASKTYFWDLFTKTELQEMEDAGYVRRQTHPEFDYAILNYTEKAQFDSVWNDTTRSCRGLIIDQRTGEVIARPFKKFYNYGQPQAPEIGPHDWVVVHDKMDGSLGILYPRPDGSLAISTRGSFSSDQAIHATKIFREKYAGMPIGGMLRDLANNYTYLFEIVYPDNRIVCDYKGMDDLILLGVVQKHTGDFFFPEEIAWSGPKAKRFDYHTLADALQAAPRDNAEGFVLYLPDTNDFVKVKQEDYISKHKMIFGLNERGIWELAKNHPDPFCPRMYEDIILPLPDEVHDWVSDVLNDLEESFNDILAEVTKDFELIMTQLENSGSSNPLARKEFALLAKSKRYPGLLFSLLDGNHDKTTESIWKMIRPDGGRSFARSSHEG